MRRFLPSSLLLSAAVLSSCGTHTPPEIDDPENSALLRCGGLTCLHVVNDDTSRSVYAKYEQNLVLEPGPYTLEILFSGTRGRCTFLNVNLEAKGTYTVYESYDRRTLRRAVAVKRGTVVVASETDGRLHPCN